MQQPRSVSLRAARTRWLGGPALDAALSIERLGALTANPSGGTRLPLGAAPNLMPSRPIRGGHLFWDSHEQLLSLRLPATYAQGREASAALRPMCASLLGDVSSEGQEAG